MQKISVGRLAPILGLLGAIGPLATDMYLPGMPQIAADLGVGEGDVQFSLMAFFVGLMIGQLFYGPLSDRLGRKPMIYAGLAIFIVASVGCATAVTVSQLNAWRFAQGLGGSIGMVIGIAMVRDLYTGRTAASLVALVMIVMGVAPIVAPMLGTAIMAVSRWTTLFLMLAIFGAASLLLVFVALPETRQAEQRMHAHPSDAMRNYGRLLASRNFIAYAGTLALAQAGFFAYLAGSAFVFISVYGLTPGAYSGLFALNAIGLMTGAQIAPRLLGRFHPQTVVRAALVVYMLAAAVLCVLALTTGVSLFWLVLLLFISITAMAFVLPLNSMMALESHGAIAGTAAALMGALQFGAGAVATLVVGIFANGTVQPMLSIIAICGLLACVVAFCAFPKPGQHG